MALVPWLPYAFPGSWWCLKDPLIGNDTIHPEFLLLVRVVPWCKFPGCWQLKDKNNCPSTINNHLLEPIDVTIIHPIYLHKLSLYYPDMMFNIQTAYSSTIERGGERERERESLRFYEQRDEETTTSENTDV